ncbi:MAG TPA: hypothetical protein ENO17_02360 [Candidatus Atribacteria bacterium]|nr:hypothetical protein [Candidatus Atribacteria bacterium]
MKHEKFNKYFKIFIFWVTLIIILICGVTIFATEIYSTVDKNLIPKNTIVLDESSSQELVYISQDQSILLFRNSTSQLEQLHVGDVLWLNAAANDNYGFLRQIIYLNKEEFKNKGIIIKTIPWIENHPPIISGLIARPSSLEIGQPSDITCYAADEDKDELYYSWISTGGALLGNGAHASWIAPNRTGDYFVTCEVIDNRGGKDSRTVQFWVLDKFPLLIEQEKKLIKKYGWGNNRIIRWPDGYVEVYDATHFSRMQEVLDQWNEVMGDKVVFLLSNNPQSPVKVNYNPDLREQNLCFHLDTHWRDYQLYAAEVKINPDASFCGYPKNSYALYLHAFSGVAGFDVWKGETVDQKDWQNFNLVPEIMQSMIKALYKTPPGYNLEKDL